MSPSEFPLDLDSAVLLEIIFYSLFGVFSIIAAVLIFLEKLPKYNSTQVRPWFRRKWMRIHQSLWLKLPEIAVAWIYRSKGALVGFGIRIYKGNLARLAKYELTLGSISASIYMQDYDVFWILVIYFGISVIYIKNITLVYSKFPTSKEKAQSEEYKNIHPFNIVFSAFGLLLLIFCPLIFILSALYITLAILELNIYISFALVVLFSPIYLIGIGLPALFGFGLYKLLEMIVSKDYGPLEKLAEDQAISEQFAEKTHAMFNSFSIGVSLSFALTILALLVGHIGDPSSWIPKSLQMLISNVIFDGLTMVFTFGLLGWALQTRTYIRLPVAVLIDIVICALLACGSLYFGLIFTQHELTVSEILRVLIGFSAESEKFVFGPYFWAMHSTFIPTTVYLAAIILCWIGKTLVLPVNWFFKINAASERPLSLTGSLVAILAAVFFVLGLAAEKYEKLVTLSSQTN